MESYIPANQEPENWLVCPEFSVFNIQPYQGFICGGRIPNPGAACSNRAGGAIVLKGYSCYGCSPFLLSVREGAMALSVMGIQTEDILAA